MEKKYEEDLENFCDHGDVGDDWLVIFKHGFIRRLYYFTSHTSFRCGDEVVQAILTWVKSNIESDDPILDMGCGNAAIIFQLVLLPFVSA
jgi:hypothetical protein